MTSITGRIKLDCSRYESGEDRVCSMELSGYDLFTAASPQLGTPFGRKDVKLALAPSSVDKLLKLIEPFPELTSISFDEADRVSL
jgi:hypothetical protein